MRRVERGDEPQITFQFEGQTITARRGDSIATALLAANHITFRTTPVNGVARGPFCMMGLCFDCLVEIDNIANCQACMIIVRDGMHVRRQLGAGDIAPDRVADSDKEGAP